MSTDPMWCYENYGEAAGYIDELEAKVQELEARLEVMPEAPEWDGIATRDETIRITEKALAASRKQVERLVVAIERCYRMLLSDPDTKGALFKAENILREALAEAKDKTPNAKVSGC